MECCGERKVDRRRKSEAAGRAEVGLTRIFPKLFHTKAVNPTGHDFILLLTHFTKS